LPKDLPTPPKTVILLATPDAASSLTPSALSSLTNESTATLLSVAVDSLPGSRGGNGTRTTGYSWLITDHDLPIKLPLATKSYKSLTFCLPATNFTLPLANTVFQNGQESTLVHLPATVRPALIEAEVGLTDQEVSEFAQAQEDVKDAWNELGDLMKLVGQRAGIAPGVPVPLGSVEIQIPGQLLNSRNGTGRIFSRLPLKPLTKPRKIQEGMGNILRGLETPSEILSGASRELETAVATYMDALPEDTPVPERVDVFARLTTQEPLATIPEMLLYPGARIHRVLSGGGGWGSKAGLLSLDPQGEADVANFEHEFSTRYDGAGSEHDHGGIVKKGEWVQFFVAEDSVAAPAEQHGLQFSAVRKTNDVLPIDESIDSQEITIDGCFGAASENGIDVAVGPTKKRMDVPGGVVIVDA
jgi:hypothetical protein